MGRSISDIRDLMRLAASLRRASQEATLPGYADKLLHAAAEIEARARLLAEHVNDPDFEDDGQASAHQRIDVRI